MTYFLELQDKKDKKATLSYQSVKLVKDNKCYAKCPTYTLSFEEDER